MSHHQAEVPADGSVKQDVRAFFEQFYLLSDTPEAHQEYANQFTENGVLIMIGDRRNGRQEIKEKRVAMWTKVSSRRHEVAKIYGFGKDRHEFMLYGWVDFEFKDGKQVHHVPWAARAVFANTSGSKQMEEYEVYLDTAAMA